MYILDGRIAQWVYMIHKIPTPYQDGPDVAVPVRQPVAQQAEASGGTTPQST